MQADNELYCATAGCTTAKVTFQIHDSHAPELPRSPPPKGGERAAGCVLWTVDSGVRRDVRSRTQDSGRAHTVSDGFLAVGAHSRDTLMSDPSARR